MPAELRLFADPPDDESDSEPEAQDQLSCAHKGDFRSESTPLGVVGGVPDSPETRNRKALDSLRKHDPTQRPVLSAAEKSAALELSLGLFYERWIRPRTEARVERGKISKHSLDTELHAIRAFTEWDIAHPPDGWQGDWSGAPLSHLEASRFLEFLDEMVSTSRWAVKTATTRWGHLRAIVSEAVKLGVAVKVPALDKFEAELRASCPDAEKEFRGITACSDEELGRIYKALPALVSKSNEIKIRGNQWGYYETRRARDAALRKQITLEMQTAIVLLMNCGARAADWRKFEFGRHVLIDEALPAVVFTAQKTGKDHHIPLAKITVEHLTRLRKSHGQFKELETYLFPNLSTVDAEEPRRSTAYRRTTKILKAAIKEIGLDPKKFRCPFHSIRKSCNTRFNVHGVKRGAGMIGNMITHPEGGVAAQSYHNTLPTLIDAVESIGWPF